MKKNILFLLAIISLLIHGCFQPNPIRTNQELPEFILQQSLNSTVAFVTESANNPNTYNVNCSGFFIRPRLILSALHCFQEIMVVNVEGQRIQIPTVLNPINSEQNFARYSFENSNSSITNEQINTARIIDIDSQHDLALLLVNDEYPISNYMLSISNRMPSQTEHVTLLGHPIGIPWCVNSGIVSRNIFLQGNWELLQSSIMISGGYSGGPLVDSNGEVLGLAVAYLRGNQGISVFVSASRIRQFTQNLIN